VMMMTGSSNIKDWIASNARHYSTFVHKLLKGLQPLNTKK